MCSGEVVKTGASSTSWIWWFYKNVQKKKIAIPFCSML